MGALLERPLIKKDFDSKYSLIVMMMDAELNEVKQIYDKQVEIKKAKGWSPVHKNMPKVSGSLLWANEIRHRIQNPMGSFKHIDHPCVAFHCYKNSCRISFTVLIMH